MPWIVASILSGLAVPSSALHWSGKGTISPLSAYQGATTEFTYTVSNQASDAMEVYSVWLHFCWQQVNFGYYFKEDGGPPVTVPAGGSQGFAFKVLVYSGADGNCPIVAKVVGKAPGDLYPDLSTQTTSITINPVPTLRVSASSDHNKGPAPLNVAFSARPTGGLSPYTYQWWFGDGAISTERDPTHKYQNPGNFTVVVTLSDSANNQRTETLRITVDPPASFVSGSPAGLLLGLIGFLVLLVTMLLALLVAAKRQTRRALVQAMGPYGPLYQPPANQVTPQMVGTSTTVPTGGQGAAALPYCTKCAVPLKEGALFCDRCGTKTASTGPAHPQD